MKTILTLLAAPLLSACVFAVPIPGPAPAVEYATEQERRLGFGVVGCFPHDGSDGGSPWPGKEAFAAAT